MLERLLAKKPAREKSELRPSAREDVPAERTLHERHVLARHERRKAVKLRVDAEREVATPFLSFFSFGFMCKCLWEAPVGDTVELYKCCRVSAYPDIFLYCIVFRLL